MIQMVFYNKYLDENLGSETSRCRAKCSFLIVLPRK